jgi:phosphoribosylformylglycinamidine synthase
VVISCTAEQLTQIEQSAKAAGVVFTVLGKVTSGEVVVDNENWGTIATWKNEYDTAIEKKL